MRPVIRSGKEQVMRLNRKLGAILWSAAALAGACIFTQAQTPIGDKWWPSRWGADDQRGAANLMTPERALKAARLIRKGQVYQLGRIYEHGMPLPGQAALQPYHSGLTHRRAQRTEPDRLSR